MTIKNNSLTLMLILVMMLPAGKLIASEKAVEHLKLPDVTSLEEAKRVFNETTSELQEKTKLDEAQLHEIHIITYSLEKAVAYFAQNMDGEQQAMANNMAEIVERVHIGSENNRTEETQTNLDEYFMVAEAFSAGW